MDAHHNLTRLQWRWQDALRLHSALLALLPLPLNDILLPWPHTIKLQRDKAWRALRDGNI